MKPLKRAKKILVYCSFSFTKFQTLSSPPSGQNGRTSMLLEQRARGGFTRMLWCTNNSERPVDALAESGKLLAHNLKSRDASASKKTPCTSTMNGRNDKKLL